MLGESVLHSGAKVREEEHRIERVGQKVEKEWMVEENSSL